MGILLSNVAKNFKGLPHQIEALNALDKAAEGLPILGEDQEWVKKWRTAPPPAGKIPQQAIDLIKEFEGLSLKPYNDGVGVATIGYGTTIYPNGQPVKFTDRNISQADAEIYLANDLGSYWDTLVRTIPFWGQMTDNQRSALLSFAYNLGANFYQSQGFASISNALSTKNWAAVPAALLLYVNAGTAVEAGLKRRRDAEGVLWRAV